MSALPTVTYFLNSYTGLALTKCTIVLLDPFSGVILLSKTLSNRLCGDLVRIGHPVDWDPDATISNLSNRLVRLAFQNDPDRRSASMDALRRDLKDRVTTPPEEISGESYIVTRFGIAFPVHSSTPIVLQKERSNSKATLTLYKIFTPNKPESETYFMPHMICMSPKHAWWTTVKDTVLEILFDHFPNLPVDEVDRLEAQRLEKEDETVMKLSMPYPFVVHSTSRNTRTP